MMKTAILMSHNTDQKTNSITKDKESLYKMIKVWYKKVKYKKCNIIIHVNIYIPNNLCMCKCSVMSDSLQSHGQQPTTLLCQWAISVKNTGVGCHFLLQGIFSTQGSNPCLLHLLHCRWIFFYHWVIMQANVPNIGAHKYVK